MDSSVSPEDEIWFLRLYHHISNAVYKLHIMFRSPFCYSMSNLCVMWHIFHLFFLWCNSQSGLDRLIVEVSRSCTFRRTHTQKDSSERIICLSQRPLPTQLTTDTRDETPCSQRDSNLRPQHSSGWRHTI